MSSNTVKVCVRVRPLSDSELQRGDGLSLYAANDQTVKVISSTSSTNDNNNKQQNTGRSVASSSSKNDHVETSTFHFDQVFGPDTTQQEIFDNSDIPSCVEAALNGCGVTVFTYGSTGSGKTHTLSGPPSSSVVWNSDTGSISQLFQDYLASSSSRTSKKKIDPRYEQVFQSLGIQFRAAVLLFNRVQQLLQEQQQDENSSTPSTITIRAAMYEIYLDQVNDLLNETQNLKVRLSPSSQSFFVENLMLVTITSMDDLFAVLAQGESTRKRSTHSDSTRSHVIFSLAIERQQEVVNEYDGTVSIIPQIGKMNFVDLAGSERLVNSVAFNALFHYNNNTNLSSQQQQQQQASNGTFNYDFQKPVDPTVISAIPSIAQKFGPQNQQTQQHHTELLEAKKINQSLHVLGKVISALAANNRTNNFANINTHIPFRDSTLTKLLMDSLSGQALTLMIACVSPSSKTVDETRNTLQYATMARSISGYRHVNVGNVGSRVDAGGKSGQLAELTQLRQEVELLRRENYSMRKMLVASNDEKKQLKRQLEQYLTLNVDCQTNGSASSSAGGSPNYSQHQHHQQENTTDQISPSLVSHQQQHQQVPNDEEEHQLVSKTSLLNLNKQNNENNDDQFNNTQQTAGSGVSGGGDPAGGFGDTLRRVEQDNSSLRSEVEELKRLVLDLSRRSAAATTVSSVLGSRGQPQQQEVPLEKTSEDRPPTVAEQKEEHQNQVVTTELKSKPQQPFFGFVPANKKQGPPVLFGVKPTTTTTSLQQHQQQQTASSARPSVSSTNNNINNASPNDSNKNRPNSATSSNNSSVMRSSARALPLSLGALAFDAVNGDDEGNK